jgi:predicted PurR-regulated permease PerM
MKKIYAFPFYVKFAIILFTLIASTAILYVGQDVLAPLLLALIFSILIEPISRFLQTKLRFSNMIATSAAVLIFVLLIVVLFYFISLQFVAMADDWDKIKSNVTEYYTSLQQYVESTFSISKAQQKEALSQATSASTGKEVAGATLNSVTDSLLDLILIPIYMFLILLYKKHFNKFLHDLVRKKHRDVLNDILQNIKLSVRSYIVGLMIEMVIVSVLTAVGLMIIGVKYAILLGVITGLLNLIPYIGIVIAGILTVFASLTGDSDGTIIIGILVVNIVVQFIDNNILVPMVVSSKVEINSIASIVGIIIGGMIGGITGMFLAIPIIAILKIIFDRIDSLKPWGYLLGDDIPK